MARMTPEERAARRKEREKEINEREKRLPGIIWHEDKILLKLEGGNAHGIYIRIKAEWAAGELQKLTVDEAKRSWLEFTFPLWADLERLGEFIAALTARYNERARELNAAMRERPISLLQAHDEPNSKPENGAVFRAEMTQLERFGFMSSLRNAVGEPFTPEGILLHGEWTLKNFGPFRFCQLVHALLRSGVSVAQILESHFWRSAYSSYAWRSNAYFRQLVQELEAPYRTPAELRAADDQTELNYGSSHP